MTCCTTTALSRSALFLLGLILFGSGGCGSQPNLTLTSVEGNRSFRQDFTQAYTCRNANGDIDVVLVDKATDAGLHGNPTAAPAKQVMHIRVVWSPQRDMKAETSNAAVKWYVMGRSPQDLLQYSGIAFVLVNDDEDTCTLSVRNAMLKPSMAGGNLIDPVGASRLEGTFVARQDSARVKKVLADLKACTATADAANSQSRIASLKAQD